ncbi:hypothetical protein DMENIID0001_011440 [Sergentomyia squamirostris]
MRYMLDMSISKEKPPESSGTESPDDVVMDSSFENEIFRFAEEKVGIIPKKLKNVMSICGFTSSTTISSISTEDIENMEQYMRELDPTVAPPTKDLYGIYQKCPQKFKFGPGERALILKIKNSVSAAPRLSRAVESVSKVPSPPRTDVLAWKLKLENKIVQYMSHQDKVPSTAVVPGYKTEKTAIKKNGTGFSACVECPINENLTNFEFFHQDFIFASEWKMLTAHLEKIFHEWKLLFVSLVENWPKIICRFVTGISVGMLVMFADV